MDFYNKIEELGFTSFLYEIKYEKPVYSSWNKMRVFFKDIIDNNKSVLVYGDYDVDGLMSALIIQKGLKKLGVQKVDIYHYRERTHALDVVSVQQCIQGQYDYFIICDTGSSDLDLLKNLSCKVIILDHHNTAITYESLDDNVAMLNTTIENKNTPYHFCLSAGALCYTVMDCLLEEYGMENDSLAIYAVISLVSDCMDMSNNLNRMIYFRGIKQARTSIPQDVSCFMNEYTNFNVRFIGFWFAPRLNALFRSENLILINKFFFTENLNYNERTKLCKLIDTIYKSNREMVAKVSDIVDVFETKNFVICNLFSVNSHVNIVSNKLYNYTGLVSNNLTSKYEKTAITYCPMYNEFKGSVRDLYGRNYLNLFKRFCKAGGHDAAFGFHVRYFDFDSFLDTVLCIDKNFAIDSVKNNPLIFDYPSTEADECLINDMANYNEFSGTNVPVALIRKQFIGNITEFYSSYGYRYRWGAYTIQSERAIGFGQYVLLKPFKAGNVRLLVQ